MITGAAGQLGRALLEAAAAHEVPASGLTRHDLNLTEADRVARALDRHAPSVVINAAAFTDVEGAESDPAAAFAGNRLGPANLARACAERDVALVHVSTDYVFDGGERGPRRPNEPTRPINVYGVSKLAGEDAVRTICARAAVVRTGWLFAPWGRNFVTTMLRVGHERAQVNVVDDQWGGPTSALELARALLRVAAEPEAGTYHFGGQPQVSWCGFAEAVFDEAAARGLLTPPRVKPVHSAAYPTKARRPSWSALDCQSFTETFGLAPPDWRTSLQEVLARLATADPTANGRST